MNSLPIRWGKQSIGTDDTVTVVSKHFEMGQGAHTGIPTLVAEELDLESAPERATGSAGPERSLASKELGVQLRDCLDRLHETRRRVLTLHLLGHTPAEAAERLDFNPKKVYNLIHRGLDDVRNCLKQKELSP